MLHPVSSSHLSQPDLERIAARATTVADRLRLPLEPEPDVAGVAAYRRARWCEAAAENDEEAFAVRLAWEARCDVDAVLGPVRWPASLPLPGWTATLAAISASVSTGPFDRSEPRPPSDGRALPFEDLGLRLLSAARGLLHERDPDAFGRFSPGATQSLERVLLARLADTWAPTLCLEQALFFGPAPGGGTEPVGAPSRERYLASLDHLCADGMRRFFLEYSFLARLLARLVDLWVDATTELASRLRDDWAPLEEFLGRRLTEVTAVETALSDPHRGGRTVCILTFDSGCRVVHKPRDFSVDQAFASLLAWCKEHGLPLEGAPVRMLPRSGYGWVEAVVPRDCQDEAEVAAFYRQGGMLLALTHVLGGNDLHHENLIARGSQPVLIDLETVLQPTPLAKGRTDASRHFHRASGILERSVCHTGLLPHERLGRDGKVPCDIGGLGAADTDVPYQASTWRHVNTDAMRPTFAPECRPRSKNTPHVDGRKVEPADHVDAVVTGFTEAYHFLQRHRDALLGPGGPFAAFEACEIRFVSRPTRNYFSALRRLLYRPLLLQEGVDFSIDLESLGADTLLDLEHAERFRPLLEAERLALSDLDIPFFRAAAADAALTVNGERVEGYFTESAIERARGLLRGLDEHDLEREVGHIRGSFLTRQIRKGKDALRGARVPLDDRLGPLTADACAEKAVVLARRLQKLGVNVGGRSASWLTVSGLTSAEPRQYGFTSLGLYEGCTGIALFLSAAAAWTGDVHLRELALAAIRPVRDVTADGAQAPERVFGHFAIGLGSGLAGLSYGLWRVGLFLRDEALVEDASRVARAVDRKRILGEETLDVIGGAAGAILALLGVHDHSPSADLLERATFCGDHLLAKRVASPEGLRAWPTRSSGGRLKRGFSHGAAGIAFALLLLHRATGERRFFEAAREAIAWEDALYSGPRETWPDRRACANAEGVPPPRATAWCYGSTGIGLARLGGLPACDDADIRRDIDVALRAVAHEPLGPTARLCCGDGGRIDLLIEAALRLDRPDLLDAARRRASQLVAKAGADGGFDLASGLAPRSTAPCMPGLFLGVAGVGYQFLRLADPRRFPSVLLFE